MRFDSSCALSRWGHPVRRGAPTEQRRQRGVLLVELAFVVPILTMVIFTAIDYGRIAQYQNRLSNSAREGAAIAQFSPMSVNSGCHGDRNIVDRVTGQNAEIAANAGFTITVSRKNTSTGVLTAYTGCDSATNGVTLSPGDRVVIKVTANFKTTSPLSSKVLGTTATLARTIEVVVQG